MLTLPRLFAPLLYKGRLFLGRLFRTGSESGLGVPDQVFLVEYRTPSIQVRYYQKDTVLHHRYVGARKLDIGGGDTGISYSLPAPTGASYKTDTRIQVSSGVDMEMPENGSDTILTAYVPLRVLCVAGTGRTALVTRYLGK